MSTASLVDILPAHRFDQNRLRTYLSEYIPGIEGMTVRQFQGGQSNPTYLLDCPGGQFVLRKKPPGQLLPSAHQIEREYRVIKALHGSSIPVPRPVLLCEDPSVIGTPFYVMDYVDGLVFARAELEGLTAQQRRMAFSNWNQAIANLHRIDCKAVGLGDYGRPDNYLSRQVERWSRQYNASIVGASNPVIDEVVSWLRANLPASDSVTIVHGDFRIGNLLFHPQSFEVAAVLDWELSTLGDPVSDLAYCCSPYHLPSDVAGVRGFQGVNLTALGIPTEEEFVAAYCHRSGRQEIKSWPFYIAFSLFRAAAIVQGVYARAVQGNASNADAINTGTRVQVFAHAAHAVAYGKGA